VTVSILSERPLRNQGGSNRAVAPPYPGAYTEVGGVVLTLARARLRPGRAEDLTPGLWVLDGAIVGVCGDGRMLAISSLRAGAVEVGTDLLQTLLADAAAQHDPT
jgi:methionyl-tRNA formyltransferase